SPSSSSSPSPSPSSLSPSTLVPTLIRQGCYRCLERAFHTASDAGLRTEAFQVATLLVIRAKELGLDWTRWMAEAHTAMPGPEWSAYLDIADVVSVDPLAGDRDALLLEESARRRPREVLEGWQAAL